MNTERINKVLALAMAANPDLPLPLSTENIDLDDITTTPAAKRNTRATMYARDTGDIVRYVGNSDVVYDRIDIARYWQQSVLIESREATTVKDLVTIMRTDYGLDVLDTEVLNANSVLPDSGHVAIVIDDTQSPLYVGTASVAFTKDAGLSMQDGVAYDMNAVANTSPIVAYTDRLVNLQGSVNQGVWQTLTASRNASTKQYEHRFPTTFDQTSVSVRIRGAQVALMDNNGTYVPITRLTTYRGPVDATGYCAGIRTLSSIAGDVFRYRLDLKRADYLFDGCSGLTAIPEHLFSPCLQLVSAISVFRKTAITAIPVSVFESCGQLTNLASAFEQCLKLTAVPTGLFRTNTAVVNLSNCFLGCRGIQTNFLTAELLAPLVNLTDISYAFADCPAVTTLPVGLFKNQTKLLNAEGTFNRCSGITSIPGDLFATTTNLRDVSHLFNGCTGITGIPPGIFQYVPNLEYAEYTFANTGILTTPEVMFTFVRRLLSIDFIFSGCKELSTIPQTLLVPLLRLQSVNGVWMSCGRITTIPQTLLNNNPNILSAEWLFAFSGVQGIPVGVFAAMSKLTTVKGAFAGTPVLTVGPLFDTNPKLTNADQLFWKCTQLTTVHGYLLAANPLPVSIRGMLAECVAYKANVLNLFPASSLQNALVKDVAGLYQNSGVIGTFTSLKGLLTGVDWSDGNAVQGVVAGCTTLADYATIGVIYKTPVPSLM